MTTLILAGYHFEMIRRVLCGLATFIFTSSANAELLRYVDSDGKIHLMHVGVESEQQHLKAEGKIPAYERQLDEVPSLVELQTRPLPDDKAVTFPESAAYESLIQQAARAHQVAPDLIRAVIRVESNFNTHALSEAGAEGLMQLMPRTAQSLGVLDRREARENIAAGTLYLSRLMKRFHGDLVLSLAAYHAGPTRIERLGRLPESSRTRNYVKKVMFHYYEYVQRRVSAHQSEAN